MTQLSILWSKAAVDAAGPALQSFRPRVQREVAEISEQAIGWFMHAVHFEDPEMLLHCTGAEDEAGWEVLVRLGRYESMPGVEIPSASAGMVGVQLAQDLETPDNDLFVADADIDVGDRR
jgi:hypothetical protein